MAPLRWTTMTLSVLLGVMLSAMKPSPPQLCDGPGDCQLIHDLFSATHLPASQKKQCMPHGSTFQFSLLSRFDLQESYSHLKRCTLSGNWPPKREISQNAADVREICYGNSHLDEERSCSDCGSSEIRHPRHGARRGLR